MRLEIGCGEEPCEGFEHLDIRPLPHVEYVCDARKTPFKDNEVDEIMATNILEHIPRRDSLRTLEEWYRILKPRGTCLITVPNPKGYCKRYIEGTLTLEEFSEGMYGAQRYEEDFHTACFDPPYLKELMEKVGFKNVRTVFEYDWEQGVQMMGEKP